MPDGTGVGDVPGASVSADVGVARPASMVGAGGTDRMGRVGLIAFAVGPQATAKRDSTSVAAIAIERAGN